MISLPTLQGQRLKSSFNGLKGIKNNLRICAYYYLLTTTTFKN